MNDKPINTSTSGIAAQSKIVEASASHLRDEYDRWCKLFEVQPILVQRYMESQARSLADALIQHQPQVRFALPETVVLEMGGQPARVAQELREQLAGGLIDRLTRADISLALRQRLSELEQSTNRGVAVGAALIRHTTAIHMVHNMLPSGRTVTYVPDEGEEIPTIPVADDLAAQSAITAVTDAIAEEEQGEAEAGRGELLVPYVPAARRFYLPQWVAFDDEGKLLVNSTNEAEAHIASMQRFLSLLHAAVSLAPYIVADKDYQTKRYGMLGQLINQGRALARYETGEIISTIRRRATAQDLNRGLSLSMPYFDDQTLRMKTHDFEVIPAGRIMFVPAFVVRASEQEQAKVAQDTRLSPSTRKHLLNELRELEQAFDMPA
jgi:hypothetical protein